MARPHPGLEEFLDFTSTPVWRSAILSAALSFALLHGLALLTPAFDLDASADDVNVPQRLPLVAAMLRFAVPLGCLTAAVRDFAARRRSALEEGGPAIV